MCRKKKRENSCGKREGGSWEIDGFENVRKEKVEL